MKILKQFIENYKKKGYTSDKNLALYLNLLVIVYALGASFVGIGLCYYGYMGTGMIVRSFGKFAIALGYIMNYWLAKLGAI